jgi:maltooligosyltrehalose trehalohydrolase
MNFSAEPRRVAVRGASLLLATDDAAVHDAGSGQLNLPGHSAAVVSE